MNFKREPSGDTSTLIIEGELTIECANELRTMLLESLEAADNVRIKLEKVTEVDLSCLQLLCSAHRTALKLNKNLTLSSKESDIFEQIVKDAGYSRHKGCNLDTFECCLWIGGNK